MVVFLLFRSRFEYLYISGFWVAKGWCTLVYIHNSMSAFVVKD